MKAVLLRVGVDTGCGGIHGPLFRDGSFDYIPIPDGFAGAGVDERTYGNTQGLKGRRLVDYFPATRQVGMANRSIHFDPEFVTFTYGDPTLPKSGLRRLQRGDMLIFYCGLRGWDFESEPALYLMGYFEILAVGKPHDFGNEELRRLFANNFHVRHSRVFDRQKAELLLIKGSERSRLLTKAVCISVMGRDRAGKPLKVISPGMREVFGSFEGRVSLQRSPPRWVEPAYVARAAEFMRSLP
jgi:hypothetical protein